MLLDFHFLDGNIGCAFAKSRIIFNFIFFFLQIGIVPELYSIQEEVCCHCSSHGSVNFKFSHFMYVGALWIIGPRSHHLEEPDSFKGPPHKAYIRRVAQRISDVEIAIVVSKKL